MIGEKKEPVRKEKRKANEEFPAIDRCRARGQRLALGPSSCNIWNRTK